MHGSQQQDRTDEQQARLDAQCRTAGPGCSWREWRPRCTTVQVNVGPWIAGPERCLDRQPRHREADRARDAKPAPAPPPVAPTGSQNRKHFTSVGRDALSSSGPSLLFSAPFPSLSLSVSSPRSLRGPAPGSKAAFFPFWSPALLVTSPSPAVQSLYLSALSLSLSASALPLPSSRCLLAVRGHIAKQETQL